ncbi:hypothetical protein P3L10_026720 [Capsicum annuum]
MFLDRFIPLSKQDDMRRPFNKLRQGSMTVTEYEAKFTELSRYVPSLVADQREKVRQFVDGLEARYHGLVIRDVCNGSYSEVFDAALHFESYYEIEMINRENKKKHNSGGFSSAPSGSKSSFDRGQSRPTQLESVGQSSRNSYPARQGQQQKIQRNGSSFFWFKQYLKCSNCGRNHSTHCFRVGGPCYTCGKRGHIAKFCPKRDSGFSQATLPMQRNVASNHAHTQPARIALRVLVDRFDRVLRVLRKQVDHRDSFLWIDRTSSNLM